MICGHRTAMQLDSFETEELVQDMAALSLLKLDLRARTIRLHKIIRDLLKSRAGEPAVLHSRIVDGWGDWYNLPDVYAWQWFAWHLNQARRSGDVNRILWDPKWLRQKLEATDPNSLIRDFDNLDSDPEAVLVRSALRLSAHVIARDKNQLIPQLTGRLLASTSPKSVT